MGFYQFVREQEFSQSIEELWHFISRPENLKKITPDYMGFDITNELPDTMYPGLIISYKVSPILNIPTTWVTEITEIKEGSYFIDEQRIGPYKLWHHQHHLIKNDNNGVLMKDIISYQPPFGILGDLANELIIKNKLKEIFDYRHAALEKEFNLD